MKYKSWHYILAGVAGLLLGCLLFLPWSAIGDYALEKSIERAAAKQVYISVASHETEGVLGKTFVLRGIRADYPVFSATLRELRITPHLLSLLSSNQKVDLVIGRGELIPVTRQTLEWNSGTARVVRQGDTVTLEEIDIRGAFSAKGSLTFSTVSGTLSKADLTMTLPEEMDRALQMFSSSGMAPLRKVKNGEWRVER